MDEHHLYLPLHSLGDPISTKPTASTANTEAAVTITATNHQIFSPSSCIALRVLLVIFVVVISVWANNEASKGFMITVISEMKDTAWGDKFYLFYVSNDEATRLVQSSATFASEILYSDTVSRLEQHIDQVDIRLSSRNLTHDNIVVTRSFGQENKFVLSLSPMIMEFRDFRYRIRKEIQRGMAEVFLFDNRDRVPRTLLDGMVEYISNLAGFDSPKPLFERRNSYSKCWEDMNPRAVAQFLEYCEGKSQGFIRRLYQAMNKDNWDDFAMDKALGMKATPLCESFHSSMQKNEDLNYLSS